MKEIKAEVAIDGQAPDLIDPHALPLNMTIEELVNICHKKKVDVTITLQEKDESNSEVKSK